MGAGLGGGVGLDVSRPRRRDLFFILCPVSLASLGSRLSGSTAAGEGRRFVHDSYAGPIPLASWWTSRAAPLRYIFVHPYTHMYGYIYFL